MAFTKDFKLPEDARPLCSGGEHLICLQTSNDVIFLTADSRDKQGDFFKSLARQLDPPPTPHDIKSHSAPILHTMPSGNTYDDTAERRMDSQVHPRGAYSKKYSPKEEDVKFTHTYMNSDSAAAAADVHEYDIHHYEDYGSIYDNVSPTSHPPLPPPRNENRYLGKDQRLGTSPPRELEANIRGNDSPFYPSTISQETTATHQSLQQFVETFRSEKFKRNVHTKVQKPFMNWKEVKLCRVKNGKFMVAALSPSKYRVLHVGDVIMKVNNHALSSPSEFYKRIESCGTDDQVELEVLRVPYGWLCHATLSDNGRIDCLGLKFGDRKKFGVEVISIEEEGLVFKSHQLPSSSTEGITDPTKRVNWGLVEINKTPVPLDSSKEQVEQLLRDAGVELALVFLPMDLVHLLREASCAKVEQGE